MSGWEDVTTIFNVACQELAQNAVKPMLNSINFSLFDSMSAVELMDPKMDQCCTFSSELGGHTWSSVYRIQFPDDVDRDVDMQTKLLQDLCTQLQKLFAAQISVINGASIMESTHNWTIMWKSSWECLDYEGTSSGFLIFLRQVLVNFGKSINKVIGLINSSVLAADIFEDEDFCPNFRQFVFDKDLDAVFIAQQLQALANSIPKCAPEIVEKMSALLKLQSQLLLFCNDYDQYVSSTITLCNRILKARKSNPSTSDSEFKDQRKVFQGIVENIKYCGIEGTQGSIRDVQRMVRTIVSKHESEEVTTDSVLSLYKPFLARLHLVGPLRKVEDVNFANSLVSLQQLCQDLTKVQELVSSLPNHLEIIVSSQDIFADVGPHNISWEQVFQQFSDLSKENLHLLSRSFLVAAQHVVSLDLGTYLVNAMHRRGIPKSVLSVSSVMEEWITRSPCLAAWESMKFTAVCRNRMISRIENILALWGNVATESFYMDDRVRVELALPKDHQHPWFASWSMTMTTRFMDLYMQLLMDMEVVDIKEYGSLFWYWDYIYTTQVHALDKLRALNYQLEMALYEAKELEYRAALSNANNKKATKKNKQKLSEPVPPAVLPPFAEDLVNRGKGQLCRGLFRVNIILKQLGLLQKHNSEFTSTGFIFERRFRPFQDVFHPNALSFREFIQTINKESQSDMNAALLGDDIEILPIEDVGPVLQSAVTCFQNARKYLDEAKKSISLSSNSLSNDSNYLMMLTNLTKVSVASLLNTTKLVKTLENSQQISQSTKVIINRSYDGHFPVHEMLQK